NASRVARLGAVASPRQVARSSENARRALPGMSHVLSASERTRMTAIGLTGSRGRLRTAASGGGQLLCPIQPQAFGAPFRLCCRCDTESAGGGRETGNGKGERGAVRFFVMEGKARYGPGARRTTG